MICYLPQDSSGAPLPSMTTNSEAPSCFQAEAMKKTEEVLTKHHVSFEPFTWNIGAKRALWSKFDFQGEEYLLAIYEDELNMIQGPNLFECYMPEEFHTDRVLIESFMIRLDRLLSGGDWASPEEGGPLDSIKRILKSRRRDNRNDQA